MSSTSRLHARPAVANSPRSRSPPGPAPRPSPSAAAPPFPPAKDHGMMLFVGRWRAAAALLSTPAALSAHRMWLLPSATVFSGTDGWVTVDAAVSNDLFF